MSKDKPWKQVKVDWRDVVLVCRKCSKKLDGGFGPDGEQVLAKALRKSLATSAGPAYGKVKARRRDIAVMEIGCLDICPKKAVVMVKCSATHLGLSGGWPSRLGPERFGQPRRWSATVPGAL